MTAALLVVLFAQEEEDCLVALFLTPGLLSALHHFRSSLLLHQATKVSWPGDSGTQGREGEGQGRRERQKPNDERVSGVGTGRKTGVGGGWGGGREREEAERENRHEISSAEVAALVRGCLQAISRANKAWNDVPNAQKMRMGVDGLITPEALLKAPPGFRDAWTLAQELKRPHTRASQQAGSSKGGGGGDMSVTETRHGQEEAESCEITGRDVSDAGASSDSADSQEYCASLASRSSVVRSLPPVRHHVAVAPVVGEEERKKKPLKRSGKTKLPPVRNAKRGGKRETKE
jgi:hypothetical protein